MQLTHNVIELQFSSEKARDAFEKKLPIAEDGSMDIGNSEQRLLNVCIAKPHPGLQGSAIHGDTVFFMRFLNGADVLQLFSKLAGPRILSIKMYSEEPDATDRQLPHTMRWLWNRGDTFVKVSELPNSFIQGMRYYDHISFGDSTPEAVRQNAIDIAMDDPNVARIEYHKL